MEYDDFNAAIAMAHQRLTITRQRLDTILLSLTVQQVQLTRAQKDAVREAQRELQDASAQIDHESQSNTSVYSSISASSFQRRYQSTLRDADAQIDKIFLA